MDGRAAPLVLPTPAPTRQLRQEYQKGIGDADPPRDRFPDCGPRVERGQLAYRQVGGREHTGGQQSRHDVLSMTSLVRLAEAQDTRNRPASISVGASRRHPCRWTLCVKLRAWQRHPQADVDQGGPVASWTKVQLLPDPVPGMIAVGSTKCWLSDRCPAR